MKYAVIVSKVDPAGMNIKERLLKRYEFVQSGERLGDVVYSYKNIDLYTVEKASIYNEGIDKEIECDVIIFATTHKAESGVHSLSVHAPGNWGSADLGGKVRTLCVAPSRLLRFALFKLEELNAERNLGYEVVQECTHHGPYVEKPVMFIEIGSDESSWVRKDAGEAIADTIIFITQNSPPDFPIAFGIGGLHHTPRFTSFMHKTDYCFGHVCPKYRLEELDGSLVKQAMEKSGATKIFVEWKGLAQFKQKVVGILDSMNVEYEKIK